MRSRALLVAAALLGMAAFGLAPPRGLELERDGAVVAHGLAPARPLAGATLAPEDEFSLRGLWRQERPGVLFLALESADVELVTLTLDGRKPRRGRLPAGPLLGCLELERGAFPFELVARVIGPAPNLALSVGEEVPDLAPLAANRFLAPHPTAPLRLVATRCAAGSSVLLLVSALLSTLVRHAPRSGRALTAVVIGSLSGLLVIEAGLRLARVHPRPRVPGSILVDYDFRPGASVRYLGVHPTVVHEFTTQVHWNDAGWRDAPFGATGRARQVAVLGDSFVAAHEVELDETFHRRLEQAWPEVELLALGRGGTGPVQQLEILRTEGAARPLDAVLWFVFLGNDVIDSSVALADERRRWVEEVFYGAIVPARIDLLGRAAASGSRLVALLADRGLPWIEARLDLLHPHLDRASLVSPAARVFDVPAPAQKAPWDLAWQDLERALAAGAAWCAERDIPLVLIVAPSEGWPLPGPARRLDRSRPAARLAAICERLELERFDLEPAFAAAAPDTPLFFPHDGHWTPAGHALTARTLARALAERPWLTAR